jgi:hypothetical protein
MESSVYGWGALGSTATGYYGSDPNTFFAAVSTGAAGTYVLDLGADADFRTDLIIGLGQSVVITGDPNSPAPLAWGTGSFEVKEGGALALSYLALTADNKISLDEGARAVALTDCTLVAQVTIPQGVGLVALTDCALNFVAEGAFTGGGAAVGTSNTCPEVPLPAMRMKYTKEIVITGDPIVYDSADPLRRTTATVSCDGGRGAGTKVADPTVMRACRADGSWSVANPSCEPCCSSNGCSSSGSSSYSCGCCGSGCCVVSSGCGGGSCCDLAC